MSTYYQKITIPCAYFYGELDTKYKQLSAVLPHYFFNTTIYTVPKASHLCHWESPQFLEQSIKKWAKESKD